MKPPKRAAPKKRQDARTGSIKKVARPTSTAARPKRPKPGLRKRQDDLRVLKKALDQATARGAALAASLKAAEAALAGTRVERDEALDQQNASVEVLGVISSYAGELEPVFDAILKNAVRICQASLGYIVHHESDRFIVGAMHGLPPDFADYLRHQVEWGPDTVYGQIARTRKLIHFHDTMQAPAYLAGNEAARAAVEKGKARTSLHVPMVHEGKLVGIITIFRDHVRPFTEKQIALVETFAAQAAIAIENARLLTELRESLERQTAMSNVLGLIASSPQQVGPVVDAIVDNALRLCDAVHGVVFRIEGDVFYGLAHRGLQGPAARAAEGPFRPGPTTPAMEMVRTGAPVHVADLRESESYRARDPAVVAAVERIGVRTFLFVPMLKDGKVVGAINVHRREVRPFSDKQVELLENFAAQAVIAMENTRLLTELRESLERQTATADILRVIASTPGEPTRALDTISETAARMFGASSVIIRRLDGDSLRVISAAGPTGAAIRRKFSDAPIAQTSNYMVRCMIEDRQLHFENLAAANIGSDVVPARLVRQMGVRTAAYTPLTRDEEGIGAMAVFRSEVRPFRPDELELMRGFADQAVIAIENARLLTELRESLQRQTATSEVLSVISSAPGELQPVFDTILDNALRVCEAHMGSLFRFEDGRLRNVADRGSVPALREYTRDPPLEPNSIRARVLREKVPLHILDMADTDAYRARVPSTVMAVEVGSIRTNLTVPLLREDEAIGLIIIFRREVRPFTKKQIELVENFAAQAVIAIENARLLTELRESLDRQTATSEVLRVISSSPGNVDPVFATILENAMPLCEAEMGHVWRIEGETVRLAAARGALIEIEPLLRQPSPWQQDERSGLAQAIRVKRSVQIDDLKAHPMYVERVPLVAAMVDRFGIRTLLHVPMVKDGAVVGDIALYRPEVRPFNEKQITLVENFAKQAVIAIENARLLTELRESLDRQSAMSDVLAVISSRPGELRPVFDSILESACRLCEADTGNVFLIDAGGLRFGAWRGATPKYEAWIHDHPLHPFVPGGPISITVKTGKPYQIVDERDSPAYAEGAPGITASVDLNGARTHVFAPMVREQETIGLISIYRREVRPFEPQHLDMLANFAKQAVIAIENARLLTELRQRTEDLQESLDYQTATSDVLKVISRSAVDLNAVLETVVTSAVRLCRAEYAVIFRKDGEDYRFAAGHGLTNEYLVKEREVCIRPGTGTVVGRAALDGRTIQIADAWTDPLYEDKEHARAGNVRAMLGVPLMREGVVVGVIGLARSRIEPYSEREVQLVTTFADQAVIAIENARLFGELRESLDRQTATAEVLSVISSSLGELQPVFDTILEKAHRLCGVSSGTLQLYDGRTFRAVAVRGLSEALVTQLRSGFTPAPATNPDHPHMRMLSGERVAHIHDLATIDDPFARAAVERGGTRTLLYVAMRKDDKLLGLIGAARQEVRPFSEKEIALLENFAKQAVIAIENARLLTELRESLDRQTATSDVLGVIASSPGRLEPVFDTILANALALCEAHTGHVWRKDEDGLRAVALRGAPEEFSAFVRDRIVRAMPESPAGRAMIAKVAVQVADLREEPLYLAGNPMMVAAVELAGVRTVLYVPMIRSDDVVGMMTIYRREVRPFTPKQIELVENFAKQAVIAIENARLLSELRESLQNQTASAEVLRTIASSPAEAGRALDTIAEVAAKLFDASSVNIRRLDGDVLRFAASHGRLAERARAAVPETPVDMSTISGAAMLEQRQIAIDDASRPAALQRYPNSPWSVVTESVVATPLLREGRAIGVILSTRERQFTTTELAQLTNFADQAVIAIENARLLSELRESLDRQTATSEVLSVISSSPGELQPVFDTMLANATRICEADRGSLFRREGNRLVRTAHRGLPSDLVELRSREDLILEPEGGRAPERMMRQKTTIHIPDYQADDWYRERHGTTRVVTLGEARTGLWVPMLKDGEVVGAFSLLRAQPRPFSEKQIELVENFAKQAVIAVENARLLIELRESLDRQTATSDILRVIASTPGDPTRALDTIAETAVRMFHASNVGIRRVEGDTLPFVAAAGPQSAVMRDRIPEPSLSSGDLLARSIRENRQICIDDIQAASSEWPSDLREVIRSIGVGSAAFTPLMRDGRAIGGMAVNRLEVRPFQSNELELMRGFADQAVIAIENARLLSELRSRTEELAQRQSELRVTFDNMGDGVAMFDAEQRLVSWNRNLQEILDLTDSFFAQPRTFRHYITYLIERGEFGTVDLETELQRYADIGVVERRLERVRPDGRVLEIRNNPVPGGGFVTIYSDVTERKRAEEQIRAARDAAEKALDNLKVAQASLIQAEKMASLGQLTAGIAHEIKNPLNFVNNFAGLSVELLEELKTATASAVAVLDKDKRGEVDEVVAMLTGNLEKIAEHGRRADGIVKSMLAHSRGSSGERQEVNINALVEESLNLAYHGARAQDQNFNITMERDFDPSIAPIAVVPQDITRVFLNLFGNGFYAANKRKARTNDPHFRPTLKVTTRDLGQEVAIHIRDNGIGIPPENRAKLFEPFFTTKPTGEGTGLGLSISYEIVTQQHGGTIEVESEPGQFTEFTVRLPRRSVTAAGANSIGTSMKQ